MEDWFAKAYPAAPGGINAASRRARNLL